MPQEGEEVEKQLSFSQCLPPPRALLWQQGLAIPVCLFLPSTDPESVTATVSGGSELQLILILQILAAGPSSCQRSHSLAYLASQTPCREVSLTTPKRKLRTLQPVLPLPGQTLRNFHCSLFLCRLPCRMKQWNPHRPQAQLPAQSPHRKSSSVLSKVMPPASLQS